MLEALFLPVVILQVPPNKSPSMLTIDSIQVAKLIHELQQIARSAGHDQPLLIALDQEHGMVFAQQRKIMLTLGLSIW